MKYSKLIIVFLSIVAFIFAVCKSDSDNVMKNPQIPEISAKKAVIII